MTRFLEMVRIILSNDTYAFHAKEPLEILHNLHAIDEIMSEINECRY